MFEHSHPTIYGQVFVHGLLFVLNIVFHGCVCGWQLREAAILAIGTVAGSLHKAKVGLISQSLKEPALLKLWIFPTS
jgi:hypothetical protein